MPYLGKQPSRTAFDASDIPDDSITAAKIVDGAITIADIADDAVTAAKLANSINTEIAANTAKVTNATHTGDVTGATALTIAAGAVDLAMLSATGTAGSGNFLRGDNTWATAGSTSASDLTSGTLPIARIADGAVTAAKVAADVATQAELDTVSTVASAALPKAGGTLTGDVNMLKTSGNSEFKVEASGTDAYATVRVKNDAKDYSMQIRSDQGDAWTVRDETAGANRIKVDGSTGDTILGGDLVFETAGKGICLGVTSNTDANTLDDYEQGTWTVELKDTSDNEAGYNSREGSYTKVGDRVHLNGNLYLSGASALTGGLYIKGLPFANNQSAGVTWGELRQTTRGSGNVTMLGVVSSSSIELLKNDGNGRNNSSALDASAVGAATQWIFNVTYRTNV
jgi:hypothetical protein